MYTHLVMLAKLQASILTTANAAIAVMPLQDGRGAPPRWPWCPFGWPWNFDAAKARVAMLSQSVRSRPETINPLWTVDGYSRSVTDATGPVDVYSRIPTSTQWIDYPASCVQLAQLLYGLRSAEQRGVIYAYVCMYMCTCTHALCINSA